MPIYEYSCESCGEGLEKLQRMSDDYLVDCPACDEPKLKRLVSAAAFRLKGSGWYETDFKQGDKRNLADTGKKASENTASSNGSGKKAETSSTKGGEKKADAKPVAKTGKANTT